MTHAELETLYEALATNLDAMESQKRKLFLAKLVLLLAQEVGTAGKVVSAMDDAARNLHP